MSGEEDVDHIPEMGVSAEHDGESGPHFSVTVHEIRYK